MNTVLPALSAQSHASPLKRQHGAAWNATLIRPPVLRALQLAVLATLLADPAGAWAQAPGAASSATPSAASSAQAPTSAGARPFDIPAGALGANISRFAAAAGVAISFDPGQVQGLQSGGLQGQYTVEQGFAQLLRNSGWEAQGLGGGNYVLRKAMVAPGTPATSVLPSVSINAKAEGESATRSTPGYVAKRSATATKTDVENREIPQSISVVTRDQMDDQGAAPALQDVLRYTPGLIGTRGINLTDDSFNMRGFAAGLATSSNTPVFRDGLRQAPAMYASVVETYGLERIDVMRGPASVLFGQVAPGGLINVISKHPTETPLREIDVQTGSHDHKQVGVDLGGPLGKDGEWSYRLTSMVRDSGTQVDYIPNKREYIAPALTWRPSADTSLTLLAMYQHTRTAYNWGLPVAGTLLGNVNGNLPRNRFTGEPNFDKYDTKTATMGWEFEHRLGETWTLRQNARYYSSDMKWNSAYGTGLQANQALLNRFAYARADQYRAFNIDNQLQARWTTGNIEHTTLIGLDRSDVDWVRNETRGTVAALNLYSPSYGAAVTLNAQPSRVANTISYQTGYYLQEQAKIDKHWVLLAGVRYDQAGSRVSGYTTTGAATSPRTPISLSDRNSATTGRLGAVYLFDNGITPYVSAATSFEPESGATDFNNNAFKPTRGRQYEAGVKYEPKDQPLVLSAAVYDLRRNNVLTADPLHVGYSIQAGQIWSRGLELEAKGKVARNTELIASYTYTDAEITESNNGDKGTAPAGVPRHSIALWGVHKFGGETLAGMKVGVGVRRVVGTSGYVLGTTPTPAQLPTYNVVDAMASFEHGHWLYTLNVSNLFNKTYVQSCYYATTTCYYGDGFNAIARATYRW